MGHVTKPGKYGTLHLYRLTYQYDPPDPGMVPQTVNFWGYDQDHAIERFYDSWPDAGWKVTEARPVQSR